MRLGCFFNINCCGKEQRRRESLTFILAMKTDTVELLVDERCFLNIIIKESS